MTWFISQPDGTQILNSFQDLGVYLLDVIDVTEGIPASNPNATFPSNLQNVTRNYDYSTQATRIFPVVIAKKVWNYGWIPQLVDWSNPNDTTFGVRWINRGGGSTGDAGFQVYVFGAGAPTTTGTTFSWNIDDGVNEYLSANRSPMRFYSTTSHSLSTSSGSFGTPNNTRTTFNAPAATGNAILTDLVLPIIPANTGRSLSIVPNEFTNVGSGDFALWSGENQALSSVDVHWFTSRWPLTNTGTPYMLLRDESNRIFFDSRERYLRVLDIQIQPLTINAANSHTSDGTTLVTFDAGRLAGRTWGYIINIGGLNPAPNSASAVSVSGTSLIMNNTGIAPNPVIAIAVDISGL